MNTLPVTSYQTHADLAFWPSKHISISILFLNELLGKGMSHNPAWIPLCWTLPKRYVYSKVSQVGTGSSVTSSINWKNVDLPAPFPSPPRITGLCIPLYLPSLADMFVGGRYQVPLSARMNHTCWAVCYIHLGFGKAAAGTPSVSHIHGQQRPSKPKGKTHWSTGDKQHLCSWNKGACDTGSTWRVVSPATWRNHNSKYLQNGELSKWRRTHLTHAGGRSRHPVWRSTPQIPVQEQPYIILLAKGAAHNSRQGNKGTQYWD